MYFDQRIQAALRELGLDTEEISDLSASVVDRVAADVAATERFLSGVELTLGPPVQGRIRLGTPHEAL